MKTRTRGEQKAYRDGVRAAAEIASNYDSSSTHEYKLEDCILHKLNLLGKKKVRPNHIRVLPVRAWELNRLLRAPAVVKCLYDFGVEIVVDGLRKAKE